MKNIPDGQLIRVQPSPLYIGEIYSSSIPTMDEITKLAMPKPKNDYTLYHGSPITYPKTKIYKPLLLASNAPGIPTESDDDNEQKTLGDCVWDCIKKQYGFDYLTPTGAGVAATVSSNIPKSWVGIPIYEFNSKNPEIRGKVSTKTSVPSIIQHYKKKCPDNKLLNNKIMNSKIMQGTTQKNSYKLIFNKKAFAEEGFKGLFQKTGTKGLLRFAGRWIPWIGWGLLAIDVAMISKCSYDCYNSDDNPPIA